jgi:hypothetical protein
MIYILMVRIPNNTCDDWPMEFGYDWMGKHMATITWKLHDPDQG